MAMAASSLWAQDGFKGALSQASLAEPMGPAFWPDRRVVIANFDGDKQLDAAVLVRSDAPGRSHVHRIELHLTEHNNTSITFASTDTSLQLQAFDIDHDGDIDIMVERKFSHERVGVWLNDGHGGFQEGRIADYPAAVDTRVEVKTPSQGSDFFADLSGQRGFDLAVLARNSLSGYEPSTRERVTSPSSGFLSCPLTASPSRAPPFLVL
jgi:hypothetical protein